MMAVNEIVHVAVAPLDRLEEDLVAQVAAIVDKDVYGTRLLLAGKIPKIIARYDTVQMAESAAHSLRTLGLVAIMCKNSDLRRPSQKYRAHTLKFEEQAVLFWDKGGQVRQIESKNAFLIINGRMQSYTETEVTKTGMKLNLAATVLTGGIPIMQRVKEKTTDMSLQTEGFVRLYDRTSPELNVEILQHAFDYSFLGAEMAPSSITNFGTTVTRIRDILPQAVFDDRLTKSFGVNIPSTAPQQRVEINCKLIYLCHKAVSNLGSPA
jgi:hypothetical protein